MALRIDDLANGQLPPEIAKAVQDLLLVEGRIQFPLKKTSASAVSTASNKSGIDDTGLTPQGDVNDELDNLIDSVANLEDLVEQLEDMNDELLSDMSIPPANDNIAKAVNRLGGNNNITKPILDNALSILELGPIMSFRNDPVLAALTGFGNIEGPWMKCSEVLSSAPANFKTAAKGEFDFDTAVEDQTNTAADSFEQNLADMILHILLMLWWNMIWPKFLVDLVIINPIRMMIADPLDGLIGFFKKKKIFRKKSKDWVRTKGKINRALTQFRIFLLCKVPFALWKTASEDYKPIVEIKDLNGNIINCSSILDECPPDQTAYDSDGSASSSNVDTSAKFGEDGGLETAMEEIDGASDDNTGLPCATTEDFREGFDNGGPEGLGMSPECFNAAKWIARGFEGAIYTPGGTNDSKPSFSVNDAYSFREGSQI